MTSSTDRLPQKDVTDEYAELVHYTSAGGLTGILNSQTLWATHASFLNDAEEIKLFFDQRLAQIVEDELRKAGRSNDEALIQATSVQLTQAIRKVTFRGRAPGPVCSLCKRSNRQRS